MATHLSTKGRFRLQDAQVARSSGRWPAGGPRARRCWSRRGRVCGVVCWRGSLPQARLEHVTDVGNLLTRQAVRVVASLDIPDLIADGVTGLDELAARVGVDRNALARLARHLVNRGVFTQPTPSTLGLTDVGELLRSSSAGGQYRHFQLSGVVPRSRRRWPPWSSRCAPANRRIPAVHGATLWNQMATDPLLTASFDVEMSNHAREIGPSLADRYDGRASRGSPTSEEGPVRSSRCSSIEFPGPPA